MDNAAHQRDVAPPSEPSDRGRGFVVPGVCEPGEAAHTPGPKHLRHVAERFLVQLPPFPTDDATLDLMMAAVVPDHGQRSSLGEFCHLYSQMAGSDPDAVAEYCGTIPVMRDPAYHPNDVISALITEIRRLRACKP